MTTENEWKRIRWTPRETVKNLKQFRNKTHQKQKTQKYDKKSLKKYKREHIKALNKYNLTKKVAPKTYKTTEKGEDFIEMIENHETLHTKIKEFLK